MIQLSRVAALPTPSVDAGGLLSKLVLEVVASDPLLPETRALACRAAWGGVAWGGGGRHVRGRPGVAAPVLLGRREFSPRTVSSLTELREGQKWSPSGPEGRSSWAAFRSEAPPASGRVRVEKRGDSLRETRNLPSPALRAEDLSPLPALPADHHAVMVPQHRATAGGRSVSRRSVPGEGGSLGRLGPAALCGFGVSSQQWLGRQEREEGEPRRALVTVGGDSRGSLGLPRWSRQGSGDWRRHRRTPGPRRAPRTGPAQPSSLLLQAGSALGSPMGFT